MMAALDVDTADLEGAVLPGEEASIRQPIQPFGAINSNLESLDLRADPDAQATVNDFLDFTEYLPSDMTRSLTLIEKLDTTYVDASTKVHELTTTWGRLPSMPPEERPLPYRVRAGISENLNHALNSRIFAQAEAMRMSENVNRHYNRAKTILAKLKTMAENYPPPEEQKSPVAPKSPQMVRAPKITLRVEGGSQTQRRQRVARIIVPGEVLAPYELNYESDSDEDEGIEDDDDDESLPRATPAAQGTRIKLVKPGKPPKIKVPKPVRPSTFTGERIRGPIASLSQLPPPPENAVLGSPDAPWLQLTPYELAKLRKRMKKNAQWTPSETMISRELKQLGRGFEAWKLAKKQAEDEGRAFEGSLPVPVVDEAGVAHPPLGALSIDAALAAEDKQNSNRGMKLNQAKKMKKENLSKLAAQEAEESMREMIEKIKALQSSSLLPANSLEQNKGGSKVQAPSPSESQAQSQPPAQLQTKQSKKRKRGGGSEADGEKADASGTPAQKAPRKRTKTETPVPLPQATPSGSGAPAHETPVPPPLLTAGSTTGKPRRTTPVPLPLSIQDPSVIGPPKPSSSASSPLNSVASSNAVATTVPIKPPPETHIPPPLASPKKSVTPIMPPARETRTREATRKEQQKETQGPASTKAHSRPGTPSGPSTAPDGQRRPQSRGAGAAGQDPQQSLAADRPRRASTARNTPAPEQRQPAKRPKRPAPGVISRTNSGGNSAVGRRKAPPKKKRGSAAAAAQKKDKDKASAEADVEVEVDDEGNVIDQDEPRYCLCNRVSFGTMIQCDNMDNCKLEWFHLECVDMAEIPARTTKWYCPDCRVRLKIGERGEVSARGVKM